MFPEFRHSRATPPLRVLVVDDSVVNQSLSTILLQQAGYLVRVADHGRAAVEILCDDAVPFDVVLMDCHMPEMDGLNATRAIRARPGPNQNTIVIALTGNSEPLHLEECLAAGMQGCLGKPIDVEMLAGILQRFQVASSKSD